jgi:DNA-binding response OmpR family regulator
MRELCRVLVVEPSELFRGFIDAFMDEAGYDVLAVEPDSHLDALIEQQAFHVVILASSIVPGAGGVRHVAQLAAERGSAVVIAVDQPWHRQALADCGYSVLSKPFRPRDLVALVEQLRDEDAIASDP